MKRRLKGILIYALFWILFFFFARLYFLVFQYKSSVTCTIGELSGTFLHGLKLDLSTLGYFMIIPMLLMPVNLYFSGNWYRIALRIYTYIMIVVSVIIVVADAKLYSYWGFRMDYTPLFYLKTPGEAFASVETSEIVLFACAIIFLSALFIYCYKRFADRYLSGFEKMRPLVVGLPVFIVLASSLIIPIRGGFGVAPINAGSVYFSSKMYLNHAAINAIWNVGTTAFTQKPVKNPYVFSTDSSAVSAVDSLLPVTDHPVQVLKTDRPNILIFVLESFSGYLIGPLGGDSLVTPSVNSFCREGILFSNFYASGTRTDKAMPAILDGYPAQPAQSIIKEPKKSQTLPSLIRILNDNGYNSAFWYGGEINFANFNSFVIGSGFGQIITMSNFNKSDYNSKWGVHDHILFNAFKDSLKNIKEPFIKVVLTLSSHEPFDVPMDPVIRGDDIVSKYKNSVYYTDRTLGDFIKWAKNTQWWKNTLVIFVADHAARILTTMPNHKQNVFRIPMIWMGGAVKQPGMVVSKLGGQTDIPVTLLNQMNIHGDFRFGKDLLSPDAKSFAFYTYNEGFGFITDTSAAAFDLKSRTSVMLEGKSPEYAIDKGKALLQTLFNDYLKR